MMAQRIETRLNETTVRELDGWRTTLSPPLSRSAAVRRLLEERLKDGREPVPDVRCPAADRLGALYALEGVAGFGPAKFRALHEARIDPRTAIEEPGRLPFAGRTGEKLRQGVQALSQADVSAGLARAGRQIATAKDLSAAILTHGDPDYPTQVYRSNNPVPVLYVRGDPAVWDANGAIAVVGSRNTGEPYAGAARRFATVAARNGMVVVSGFATGADSVAHGAAMEAGGCTVCVMPCGLDNVFPPENRGLWAELLAYPRAAFVSEFGFGQRASALLLRKRNKLIVAFARSVLVAQSATNGGAMNAYRFAREQRKPVATFRANGSARTSGNAVIGEDERTGGFVFEPTDDDSRYAEWLQQLSCSI